MTVIALGRRTTRLETDRAARKRDRDIAALEEMSDAELSAKIWRRLLFVDPALADRWDAANARAAAQALARAEDPFWFRKPYFYVLEAWKEIWAEADAKLAAMELRDMSVISLQNRLNRIDRGTSGRVEDMSDAQLLRIIARGEPDPAAFLAMSEAEQTAVMERIVREPGL